MDAKTTLHHLNLLCKSTIIYVAQSAVQIKTQCKGPLHHSGKKSGIPPLAVRVQIKRCELTVCAGGPTVLPESRVTSGPDPDSHTLLYPTWLKPYSIFLGPTQTLLFPSQLARLTPYCCYNFDTHSIELIGLHRLCNLPCAVLTQIHLMYAW